jgi:hypothetical protein
MSQYHEPFEGLPEETRNHTRALTSLKEEIEAVDWYNQRAAVSQDESLRRVLIHNRDEEIEHACMLLEWLRRHVPAWDEQLRTYLFTEAPIDEVEEEAEGGEGGGGSEAGGDLGIGSMKG